MGTMPTQFPHLIFANFNTKLGERVQNILKALFPPNKESSKRVASFVNQNDFISFRYVADRMVSLDRVLTALLILQTPCI